MSPCVLNFVLPQRYAINKVIIFWGKPAQAGVSARCCAAIASERAMSAATSVLCDSGMRGHSGTLSHSR